MGQASGLSRRADIASTRSESVKRMPFAYAVLGAGRQGVALAYDLAKNCDAGRIVLADADQGIARAAVERLRKLLPTAHCEWSSRLCDVTNPAHVTAAVGGAHVVLSAVPYRFNVSLTDAAIAAGASFCDLGGNTDVVRAQLARHDAAKAANVSIVPDCGLAPGLGNILAAHGIAQFDEAHSAHVRCGGLPQQRVGPLQYKLVFNFGGLINEYSGVGEFLRDGRRVDIPTLTELEDIDFAELGRCEAAVTSGGTSTCAESLASRVRTYDYKTVRYPGHFAIIRALFALGAFDDEIKTRSGETLAPRAMLAKLFEERLSFPDVRDLVVLRATISGRKDGAARTLQFDLFDKHDEATGFTAMERTTAFPTSLVAYMQARRIVNPGARPLELAIPTPQYMLELPAHDIRITQAIT